MISLRHITVQAGGFQLRDLSMEIPTGSHTALMGRTGSGKTTLLEGICGLRSIRSGSIWIGDREVTNLPPGQRGIGLVPQDGALFDHLTVRQHLEFALEVRGWVPERRESRSRELAEWLSLTPLLDRLPAGMSGGERQRVALGRALAFHPPVLCLDEPLSALDDQTRGEIVAVLTEIRNRTGITILHITHNRSEAERLADRILHLRDGRLES
ncbi:MAG: ABC transporter ATP-binding protein [Pedosphaera sp.]|jgi:ABC-type sugar transport system ATPase subunit|nr:ABC transporter ATP-binding protein [Pedosphaera sp.]